MRRRKYLSISGMLVATITSAGCIDETLSQSEEMAKESQDDSEEEGNDTGKEEGGDGSEDGENEQTEFGEFAEELDSELGEMGVEVITHCECPRHAELVLTTQGESTNDDTFHEELGIVAGMFGAFIDEASDPPMHGVLVYVHDTPEDADVDELFATYRIETEWAEEVLETDEVEEYTTRILLTVDPPIEEEDDEKEEDGEDEEPDPEEVEQRDEGEDVLEFGDLRILEHELVVEEGELIDDVFVEGIVENTSEEEYDYVEVGVRVYNEEGHQLDRYIDNTQNLDGGQTWSFEVMILEDADDVNDYDIAVTGSRY